MPTNDARQPSDAATRRINDARELVGTDPHWNKNHHYANPTLQRLMDEGLIESVPLGSVGVGPGVLISAARLHHELEQAFLNGRVSSLGEDYPRVNDGDHGGQHSSGS